MTTLVRTRGTTSRALFLAVAVAMLVTLVSPTASHAVVVDPPASTESVLVVAPHPGDATIMAGGITHGLSSYSAVTGDGVTIAYMTNNDFGVPIDDGTLQQEAVDAQVDHLNRVEDDLIFLGYPDGELQAVWDEAAPGAHEAGTGATATYAARGLNSTDWHNTRTGLVGMHAPYNQEAMIADMEALIDQRRPDHIFLGGPENNNPDYTVTYDVVSTALDNVIAANPGYGAVVHTTVVWHPDDLLWGTWPQDRDTAEEIVLDTTLAIPPVAGKSLAEVGLVWADREQYYIPAGWVPLGDASPKGLAIDEIVSQTGLGGFIGRFLHRDEIFWTEYRNFPEI